MKNFIMIFVDLIRMPVFFVYCIFVWLSRIDSSKAFKCFLSQFMIQLFLFVLYALIEPNPSTILAVTMIIAMALTLVVGYVMIGKPKTEEEWKYVFTPVKVINASVRKEYAIKEKEFKHEDIDIRESLDKELDNTTYRSTSDDGFTHIDFSKEEVAQSMEVASCVSDNEDDEVITDDDISNMIMKSFDTFIDDDKSDIPKFEDAVTEEVPVENTQDYIDDDSELIESEENEIVNSEIGDIDLSNDEDIEKEAMAIQNNSTDFRIQSEGSGVGSASLTGEILDDEEI